MRIKDGSARPIAASAEELADKIVARLTRQSGEVILAACLAEDGAEIDPSKSNAVDRALKRAEGIVRFAVALDRPLIGLGASAPVYYPAIAELLGADSAIPADADVANAIGAVVGQVRAAASVFVTMPEEGIYIVNGAGGSVRLLDEAESFALARARASEAALAQARQNGAEDPVVNLLEDIAAPEIEGQRKLVEARFIATASGRPRIAHH